MPTSLISTNTHTETYCGGNDATEVFVRTKNTICVHEVVVSEVWGLVILSWWWSGYVVPCMCMAEVLLASVVAYHTLPVVVCTST